MKIILERVFASMGDFKYWNKEFLTQVEVFEIQIIKNTSTTTYYIHII